MDSATPMRTYPCRQPSYTKKRQVLAKEEEEDIIGSDKYTITKRSSTVNECSLQQSKYVTFIFGHNYANEYRDEEIYNPPRPH